MNVLGMTCEELAQELNRRYGKGMFHAAAMYRELLQKGNSNLSAVDSFSRSQQLARDLAFGLERPDLEVAARQEAEGVAKYAFRLHDGLEIESVLVPMPRHTTICISSQVGCRMGCRICATGRMGFVRNLSVAEIVGQVYTARLVLGHAVNNVVFMGMGEPLDNIDAVIQAVRVMNDSRGLNIAHSHITVSTAGLADGIHRLADLQWPRLNLAVSLNASNDRLRSELMPVNHTVPMSDLKQALLEYPLRKKGVFFIEYVLLKGCNDEHEQALELAAFLRGLPVRVNVIPYNNGGEPAYASPSEEQVKRFCGWLAQEGLFVRRRVSRGRSIQAGCGQLCKNRDITTGNQRNAEC